MTHTLGFMIKIGLLLEILSNEREFVPGERALFRTAKNRQKFDDLG